ncbi:MAG: hypothetical protein ACXVXP_03170 [Mycobacteriaceae bacterium]
MTSEARDGRTGYVLTNRLNLNGILSSRLIGPRESYGKYYRDLLELTPGFVPVLAAPPAPDALDHVIATPRTGPVLLETRIHAEDAGVWFVPAFALADVTAIHLPDEQALREHSSRRYANVHQHDDLLRVTPELFSGPVGLEQIVVGCPAPGEPVDWALGDRLRGSFSAAAHAATDARTLEVAAALIGSIPVGDFETRRLGLGRTADTEPPASDEEEVLFASAFDLLCSTDMQTAWNAMGIVEALEEAAVSSHPESTRLASNLAAVRSVVSGERPFVPFRSANDAALMSAKALLLVLLRPELAELLTWSPAETGADRRTTQCAAVLAGALRGLARESTVLRSRTLDDATARWLVARASGSRRAFDSRVVTDADTATLMVEGDLIRTVPSRADSELLERWRTMSAAARNAVAADVAEALELEDAVEVEVTTRTFTVEAAPDSQILLRLPGNAQVVRTADPGVIESALAELGDEGPPSARVRALLDVARTPDAVPADKDRTDT